MTLVLLPNNVWPLTAQLTVTDLSDVATGDTAGLEGIVGGPRNIYWTSGGTGARRIVYVNKAGGLNMTHLVWARASDHVGKNVDVRTWTSYPSSSTTQFSTSSFAPTLTGKRGQDWVLPVAVSNQQAIGLSLNSTGYTKTICKLYASNGITLNFPGAVTVKPLTFPTRYSYRRQMYLVDEEWSFTADNLSRADIVAFEGIKNLHAEPMFIYDALGTQIHYGLLHGVVVDYQTSQIFDDIFQLAFTVRALRQWV